MNTKEFVAALQGAGFRDITHSGDAPLGWTLVGADQCSSCLEELEEKNTLDSLPEYVPYPIGHSSHYWCWRVKN